MNDHALRTHSKYSPSRSEQFSLCRGAPNYVERVAARDESEYAIEGTKAHEVLAVALMNNVRDAREAHSNFSTVCMEEFEDEFFASVQDALDYVYDLVDMYPDGELYVETYVNPPCEASPDETSGYCDIAFYVPSLRKLWVVDYKHGAGIAKGVEGNTQVMQYAGGFLFDPNSPIAGRDVDEVLLVIAQPRAFHPKGDIREWAITPYELYEYITVTLEQWVVEALDPEAPLTPGTEQCRFCEGRTTCPAREAMVAQALMPAITDLRHVHTADLPAPESLDINRLAFIWAMGPDIKKYVDQVGEHLKELSKHGHAIPGAKLVEVAPKREWYGEPAEIATQLAALANVPVAEVYKPRLLGITDAEALIVKAFRSRAGKGKKNLASAEARKTMALLTLKKSSGNVTLVSDDDPRPALNRSTMFAQIGEGLAIIDQTGDTE